MSITTNQGSGNLWHKFRSSTKSLSSSFSGLSIRSETDGDSPTSTIVHKAMVKFYKSQEPFAGFPGWLGHKEDLPDEQKILKKQNHSNSNRISNGFSHMRKASSDHKKSQTRESSLGSQTEHTSAGMAFHEIYQGNTTTSIHGGTVISPQMTNTTNNKSASVTTHSSSMLMRERLKRQNTKTSLKF